MYSFKPEINKFLHNFVKLEITGIALSNITLILINENKINSYYLIHIEFITVV